MKIVFYIYNVNLILINDQDYMLNNGILTFFNLDS